VTRDGLDYDTILHVDYDASYDITYHYTAISWWSPDWEIVNFPRRTGVKILSGRLETLEDDLIKYLYLQINTTSSLRHTSWRHRHYVTTCDVRCASNSRRLLVAQSNRNVWRTFWE